MNNYCVFFSKPMIRPVRGLFLRDAQQISTYSRRSYSSASQQEIDGARNYCLNLLRQFDHPSFVLQAFIPPAAKDGYLALRALNVDVARVADTTSHPSVGQIRMQFWRDTVTGALAGTPRKEPTAILLSKTADELHQRSNGKAKLSKNWLYRIISTREQYLGNPPYPTLAALESYAENTYSTLLYLTMQLLPLASLTADHLASHIGKATGIAAVLRGLPLIAFPPPPPTHHTSNAKGGPISSPPQGAILLPLDVMARAGVQEELVLREGNSAPGLSDAVFEVATRANDHLITAREMLRNLKAGHDAGHEFEHFDDPEHDYDRTEVSGIDKQLAEVNRAFGVLMGPALTTRLFLDNLEKAEFNIFDQRLLKSTDWKFPLKAYWAYSRKDI